MADDLAAIVDAKCVAGQAKVPEIGHHAILPEKRVVYLVARKVGLASNLSSIVDPDCLSVTPSEGSQVLHTFGLSPEKGVRR